MEYEPWWVRRDWIGAGDSHSPNTTILGPYQIHLTKLFPDLFCHTKAKVKVARDAVSYREVATGDVHWGEINHFNVVLGG